MKITVSYSKGSELRRSGGANRLVLGALALVEITEMVVFVLYVGRILGILHRAKVIRRDNLLDVVCKG